MAELTKVKVKSRGYTYRQHRPHPTDPDVTILTTGFATHDQEIEVDEVDLEKGRRLGAFYGDDEESVEEQLDGRDVVDLSDDELDEWFSEKEPTVQEVIDASKGDPESAQRLLDAENRATGNEPRTTLVEALGTIINRQ